MEDQKYNLLTTTISILGPIFTAISILIGVQQFNAQLKENKEMELNKNFWEIQNKLYTDICDNAGALIAAMDNLSKFKVEKERFLTRYYGQMVLVEDKNVEKCMIEIKYFLDTFDPKDKDPNMEIIFKRKILQLSEACRNSSLTFKRVNLE